ncbi:MAG: DUF2911 domain-containing protein [Ginsengibacter sp.]
MQKKLINLILILISALLFAQTSIAQQTDKKDEAVSFNPNAVTDTSKRSIKSAVNATIGNATIRINYYSPGVRGRIIWGELVPYGKIWVTGAHDATNIEVSKDFIIQGKEIPAGKYALFTIPGQDEWTVIINKNWNQHQADKYDQEEDIIRFNVKPKLKKNGTERLQYFIENIKRNKATIRLAWEKVQIQFDIKIKN